MVGPARDAFLVVNKPLGISSRAALDAAAKLLPRRTKVGHAGTLDPLATGVLVLAVGQATRLVERVQDQAKTYVAQVTFGATSATDDAEGPIRPIAGATVPTAEQLCNALPSFVGEISQRPPAFSAMKVAGRRAYALARAGDDVTLTARTVTVYGIEMFDFAPPRATIRVRCGKGTYIRALARDLGKAFGCGAYLSGLERTTIGPFTLAMALPQLGEPLDVAPFWQPARLAFSDVPAVSLDETGIARVRHGNDVTIAPIVSDECLLADAAGAIHALARYDGVAGVARPHRVFNPPLE